jgi:hypothetical protein
VFSGDEAMLQRVPEAFRSYGLVYDFVLNHVRMQFEDIGAMLRLPMRAHGLNNGCNFAAASVVCNLISGVSVTIFQPAVIHKPDKHGNMQMIGSGEAFREFVKAFYPDPSVQRRSDVADVLYKQLRNPFAHALGVLSTGAYQLEITKVLSKNATTPGDGLAQAEVTAIEESPDRPDTIHLGVQGSGKRWKIVVDFLYRDALDMMVGLAHDSTQMLQAEARFQAGTYVWRA